jgi:Tfp pilus assembly pilus retraction ATPase PilT
LTCRPISASGVPIEAETSIPIEQLIKRTQAARLMLVRGSAGAGKSTAMWRLADLLMGSDQARVVPIYLRLREL